MEQGSFEELMKSKGPLFDFVQDHTTEKEEEEEEYKKKELVKAKDLETKTENGDE